MARPMKTEDGAEFPAEAYAYVPDPERPGTWKLRLWETPAQKETPRQVGMAVAALSPEGFRGNRVEIPKEDLPKVKARLRAAWKKVNPDADQEDLPPVLREAAGVGQVMDGRHEGSRRLLEYSSSRGIALRVDRARSMIFGVKVLGLQSANGRRYLPEALARAASLYEGKPVNVDHQDGRQRSYRDRIGKVANVRLDSDGLYGDLIINPKHPLAEQLIWDAENCPENVGLSHDVQGRTRATSDGVVVEAIQHVRSVDLVAEPATTRSLYEGYEVNDGGHTGASVAADPNGAEDPDADPEPQPEPDPEPIEDADKLPDDAFALVLPGGVKIGNRTWPLHKRYFPIHTPDAVRRSFARIESNRKLAPHHLAIARQRALDAARKFGISLPVRHKESVMEWDKITMEQLKEARPDLVAAIQAAGEVHAELVRLKEERDQLAQELDARRKREEAARELAEAKIAPDQVPTSLREALESAPPEKRKVLIEDLRKLLATQQTVRAMRATGGLPNSFEDRVKVWA